jgi:hypothetical protein
VAFYDSSQSNVDASATRQVLESVADSLGDHLRLLLVKVDTASRHGHRLQQRYLGGSSAPFYALLDGPYKHTQYMLDDTSETAGHDLASWLLDQASPACVALQVMTR